MYYTYMIRCIDNSIYTGITTDIERRITEHKNKTKCAAKYTLSHGYKELEALWISNNKSTASKLEYYIKKLGKKEKEQLILNNDCFSLFFLGKIDLDDYTRIIQLKCK